MGQGFKALSSSELSCKWPKVAETMTEAQLPNLTQQELPLHRTPAGEHLFGFWPSQTAGEYKTVIQTDIKDKMVNTRFSFSKDRQSLIAKSENEEYNF